MSTSIVSLLCFFAMMALTEARVICFRWDVKRNLDTNNKVVFTINGKTPGPIIQAQQGDTIVVEVTNSLVKESLVINWRGIQQKGTPSCGGTGVPILPGEKCIYRFVANQAGKYLYQSEFRMQKEAGLYGSILVLP